MMKTIPMTGTTRSLVPAAGWSAYVNFALTLLNIATLSLFYAAGGLWSTLNDGVSLFMISFGLGYVAAAVGFWIGGMWHPLATVGFVIGTLAGLAWGIWLGRFLLSGRIQVAPDIIAGGT